MRCFYICDSPEVLNMYNFFCYEKDLNRKIPGRVAQSLINFWTVQAYHVGDDYVLWEKKSLMKLVTVLQDVKWSSYLTNGLSYFLKILIILWEYFSGLVNAMFLKWSERSKRSVMKKKQKQHNHQNIETEKIKYLGTTIAKDAFFCNKIKSRQNVR